MVSQFQSIDSNDEGARSLVEYALAQTERVSRCDDHLRFPPDSFPGYRLGGLVQRGGQGFVYQAVQLSTGKTVALKVLRHGPLASATERARLKREAEILVRVDHPNIVGIFDSGIAAGHNYFVMDYVEGHPLDDFVRDGDLPLRDTLELFGTICDAVHAAHSKGVVHRDLKPGNIRVTAGRTPHVLDFGMARIIDQSAMAAGTMTVTETGEFVGSLPWAAPEQARGEWDRVDARTDVYALGVTLYQLLTGRFPYQVKGPIADVMRSIAESDPKNPRSCDGRIDDELETIILKCLQKEPARRYSNAGALAKDLRLYLAGKPIDAKRDNAWYLLKKSARRHRWVAIVSSIGLVVVTAYLVHTRILLRRALKAEELQARAAAQSQSMLTQSVAAIQFIVGQAAQELESSTNRAQIRQKMLDGARDRLAALAAQADDDPRFRREEASIHSQLGDIAQAAGDLEESRHQNLMALAIREQITKEFPNQPSDQAELSIALVRVGDVVSLLGGDDSFREYYQRAFTIDEVLVAAEPDNARYLDNLLWSYDRVGSLFQKDGDLDGARSIFEKELTIAERLTREDATTAVRWYGLASARMQLAGLAVAEGDVVTTGGHYQEALPALRQAVLLDPNHPLYQKRLVGLLRSIAKLASLGGEWSSSWQMYDEAAHVVQSLHDQDPLEAVELRIDVLTGAATAARIAHDLPRARDLLEQVLKFAQNPSSKTVESLIKFRSLEASALDELYAIVREENNEPLAEQLTRESLLIHEWLVGQGENGPERSYFLARVLHRLSEILITDKRADEALPYEMRAVSVARQICIMDEVPAWVLRSSAWILSSAEPVNLRDYSAALSAVTRARTCAGLENPGINMLYHATVCKAMGDSEQARALVKEARTHFAPDNSFFRNWLERDFAEFVHER